MPGKQQGIKPKTSDLSCQHSDQRTKTIYPAATHHSLSIGAKSNDDEGEDRGT